MSFQGILEALHWDNRDTPTMSMSMSSGFWLTLGRSLAYFLVFFVEYSLFIVSIIKCYFMALPLWNTK